MTLLPVEPAYRLAERSEEHRWLVTGLWSEQAVGIVGGEPKCCKSFLALDLAVAVAAGVPCLRRFAVPRAGRVLLFAAEDALHIVRRRLEGISAAASVALANLDIQVITAPTLRLDLDADRRNLAETVARLQPRLLILDPFVRLHRIDENASGEVAPLLAYLRELQRRHGVAVLVVHHAKKGGGGVRAGQALRGSSEFHAWGDSNLYLRRDGDDLSLSVEHRAAPSMTPITIELAQRGTALALEVVDRRDPATPPPSSLDERITATLAGADAALPFAELRACCRVRATTLYERLAVLADTGRVVKTDDGYRLATADPKTSDNHNTTGANAVNAPTSQFPFPVSLQRAGTGTGKCMRRRPSRPPGRQGRSQSITFSGSALRSILPSRPLNLDAVAHSGGQDRPGSGPPKAWS